MSTRVALGIFQRSKFSSADWADSNNKNEEYSLNHALLITGTTHQLRKAHAVTLACRYLAVKDHDDLLSHPDFFLIGGEGSVGIETIRSLKTRVSYKPYKAPSKVVVFESAESLTLEASNALLKLLEEPPDFTFLFLLSPSASSMLPTIVSRCEVLTLCEESNNSETVDKSRFTDLWSYLSATTSERFLVSESFKERSAALLWIRVQISLARQVLLKTLHCTKNFPKGYESFLESKESAFLLLTTLKALLRAKEYLEANTSVRLTFDVLALSIQHIQKEG